VTVHKHVAIIKSAVTIIKRAVEEDVIMIRKVSAVIIIHGVKNLKFVVMESVRALLVLEVVLILQLAITIEMLV
jgi:hypothetical protein